MDNSTLVLTHVIFRHGQRAPLEDYKYPGDPYANEEFLPFGNGELTMNGRKQSYHLGQVLRQRYGNLLGPEYHYGIIDAKSTERSRARTTLQLVLAGLFPPTPTTKIHDQLNWHPIPFTYKAFKDDNLLGSAIVNYFTHGDSPEFRHTQNSQEVIKCIEEELKWDVQNQNQCMLLFDTVKTQEEIGLPVPKWCAQIYPDKLRKEFESFVQYNYGLKHNLTDTCGGLIQEINNIMTQKVSEIKNCTDEKIPKMYLYSAHDLNLAGLLGIFKQFDATKWPNYTANLSFELHQVHGEFYVKTLYQDGQKDTRYLEQEQNLVAFTLPNSRDILCRLCDFTEYVKEYFPKSTQL